MGKKLFFGNFSCNIVSFCSVITLVLILIILGNWQLKRLAEKTQFIQTIKNNTSSPAKSIELIDGIAPLYSKISISGKFLTGKTIFLYGRRSASAEKDGYYILSAFESMDGKKYLVSRGWIPQSLKKESNQFWQNTIYDNIEAIILPGEIHAFMVPENDIRANIWFTIDLKMAQDVLGITENKYYLMQINSSTLPLGAKPLFADQLSKIRNDHLEYAITWYSLALFLIIIFLIYCNKKS